MTLKELKGKYARISDEIDSLAASSTPNAGRLARLLAELDDVHRELAAFRRRTLTVPTLRDVVAWASPDGGAAGAGSYGWAR
jgi:hypothetical protein